MFLWKSVPKILLSWKLDRQEWWILLWPVSTALNSGTAELHHPHKNIKMAFAPKGYSAFQTSDMQKGSAVYQSFFMMDIIHTPVIQPRMKRKGCHFGIFQYLHLLLSCDIKLAALVDLGTLTTSDACKSSRKKSGLVHLFKMQRSLSQYSFAFFSVFLLKT